MGLLQNLVMSPRELCPDVVDGSSFRAVRPSDRMDEKVVCPMPRRVTSVHFSAGEPAKPFLHRRSVPPSTLDCEASLELLEILRSKNTPLNTPNFGCSPPFFPGSPPSRSANPIVHDLEFLEQSRTRPPHTNTTLNYVGKGVDCTLRKRDLPPQSWSQVKPSVPSPIYIASPRVRVEGFDCPSHGFDQASRDTRRHVVAIA